MFDLPKQSEASLEGHGQQRKAVDDCDVIGMEAIGVRASSDLEIKVETYDKAYKDDGPSYIEEYHSIDRAEGRPVGRVQGNGVVRAERLVGKERHRCNDDGIEQSNKGKMKQ